MIKNNFWNWAVLALVSKPIAWVLIVFMINYMEVHPEQQTQLSISCLLIALAVCYVWFKFGIAFYKLIFKKRKGSEFK